MSDATAGACVGLQSWQMVFQGRCIFRYSIDRIGAATGSIYRSVDRDGDRDLDRVTSIATSSLAKAVSLRGKRAHVVKGANALSVEVRWPESG